MKRMMTAVASLPLLWMTATASPKDWNVSLSTEKSMVLMHGNDTVLHNMASAMRSYGKTVMSYDYDQVKVTKGWTETGMGKARCIRFRYTGKGLPDMETAWHLHGDFVTVQTSVSSEDSVVTNGLMPIVASGQKLSPGNDSRALFVPFDNDCWIRYASHPFGFEDLTSYEVTAIFDNHTRKGYVLGSIEHDKWKSGVRMKSATRRYITDIVLEAGVADKFTRDVKAHGSFTGKNVSSPLFFIGLYDDWRDGLEAYADANAAISAPRTWKNAMPVGWNSWGALAFRLNHDNAVETSDYIKRNLQNNSFITADGTLYIGLDSGWNAMKEEELRDFVLHCESNGQKAGIYWTPFTDWGKKGDARMEYAEEYCFSDAWLYADGKPQELDGAYALDPTHPAVTKRIKAYSELFRKLGFVYVKLDFMTHGAMEADGWYNKDISSGMEAYNYGMALIDKHFYDMYLNLSISPLFPARYANSRRIACDAWNKISDTEYTLNATSYGWWLDRVYNYNDADHIVLREATEGENRARITSGVITGIFIIGDDFSSEGPEESKVKASEFLTNARVNAAATGDAFRPVEGNGEKSEHEFISHPRDGVTYYAVFNYSDNEMEHRADIARLGLDSDATYIFEELWRGETMETKGSFSVKVPARDVKFYSIRIKKQ